MTHHFTGQSVTKLMGTGGCGLDTSTKQWGVKAMNAAIALAPLLERFFTQSDAGAASAHIPFTLNRVGSERRWYGIQERREALVRRMLSGESSIAALTRESGTTEQSLYRRRNQVQGKDELVSTSKKHEKLSVAQMLVVVMATASLNEAELAEYCRKNGLYPEQVKGCNRKPNRRCPGRWCPGRNIRMP